MEDSFREPRSFSCTGGRNVARDVRLSRALEECHRAELCAMAAYTYRAAVTEPYSKELSDVLDRIAMDEMEHFRLIGSLIVSLGGNPALRIRWESGRLALQGEDPATLSASLTDMVMLAMREKREEIDRYQTLMGRTEDRIVRSFLCQILSDEERHVAWLKDMK